jgi:hypothetical protein
MLICRIQSVTTVIPNPFRKLRPNLPGPSLRPSLGAEFNGKPELNKLAEIPI